MFLLVPLVNPDGQSGRGEPEEGTRPTWSPTRCTVVGCVLFPAMCSLLLSLVCLNRFVLFVGFSFNSHVRGSAGSVLQSWGD